MRHAVRSSRFVSLCLLILSPLFAATAHAGAERQLVAAINDYRAHPQRCRDSLGPTRVLGTPPLRYAVFA